MLKIQNQESDDGKKKSKKQKLVKHKHKNWSKLDVSEIERGIDNLRQEQLTGGVRAEKRDDELFFISKSLSNKEDSLKKKAKLTLEQKMASLNCYRLLRPDTENSAPAHCVNQRQSPLSNSKRQQKLMEHAKKTQKPSKATNIVYDEVPKWRQPKPIVPKTQVQLKAEFGKDLWGQNDDIPIVNETNKFYLEGQKLIPPKKPTNPIQTTSCVPKVELPHPGTSYNPDYDDHQDLLMRAHLIELQKLKEEEKLMRKLTVSVKKMSWEELEKVWLEEMSTNELFDVEAPDNVDNNNQENDIDDESKKNEMSISKRELRRRLGDSSRSKQNETKAKRQRRLLLEKVKKRQKENEKQQRIQQNEIFRLKSLKRQVDESLNKADEERKKRALEEEKRLKYATKRIGRLKYEEPELELKLSGELTSSLRTLKPEGNILTDRYKSLQKRNIIEPRVRAKTQRKYWRKKFAKRTALEVTNYVK